MQSNSLRGFRGFFRHYIRDDARTFRQAQAEMSEQLGCRRFRSGHLLAIASPTHLVSPEMYYKGWAGTSELQVNYRQNWSRTVLGDHCVNGQTF